MILPFGVADKGVFRLEPHGGDRVPYFVRNACGHAPDRRQTLSCGDLASELIGSLTRKGKPPPRFIQRRDDAIEFALARGGQCRQFGNVIRLERSFDLRDMA